MSSNKNLFYNLYSNSNKTVSSGYICNSAVDESGTSFDITANSNGSAGVITDSNGNTLSSIDMSTIHTEGLTQYNTETRILQPYSCCLLQGQEYGLAQASYYYVVPKQIEEQELYPYYVSCSFDVIYNNFCPYVLHCDIKADGKTSIDDLINDFLKEKNVEVSVSIQNITDDIDGKTRDYLVFLAQKEAYFYYINNLRFCPCFQSADYPDSPFSKDIEDIKETIYGAINTYKPRQTDDESEPYEIDCFLYKFLLENHVEACKNIDILKQTVEYFREMEAAQTDKEWEEIFEKTQLLLKDTIYCDFINDPVHSYDADNLSKVYQVVNDVKEFIDEAEEYYQDIYWLKEDLHLRIPLMKYPNGAFRGIVLIPDWDTNSSEDMQYKSLWINHVKSTVLLYRPTKEHQYLPKRYGVLANATIRYEEKEYRCYCGQNFTLIESNAPCQQTIPNGFCDDISTNCSDSSACCKYSNLDTDYLDPYRPQNSIYEDTIYMGQNVYAHKDDIIGLFRYMQYVNENNLWNKVGDAYVIIGKDDDPQSKDKNLPESLLIYNPNPEPIRIKYMIFS